MKVLVVGSGGREHALVEALAASPLEPDMYAAPGNVGISRIAETVDISVDDLVSLRDYAAENEIDLTVVGPEVPLIGGISEAFWEAGLKVFGPSRAAARVEGSKVFAKELMRHAGVPTARFEAFDREEAALGYLRAHRDYPIVVKADGAAAGKGVTVAHTQDEAEEAVRASFAGKFGAAGERMVIEEYLEGREASIFVVTEGQDILPFLPAQDYKRIYDGDEGPNTGGMGSYSPVPGVDAERAWEIARLAHQPVVDLLGEQGTPFHGVLYAGLMMTAAGPKVLEYNARFGDPETQAVLPRLRSDLLELLEASTRPGGLAGAEPDWSPDWAVTVVLASRGYPESSSSGDPISGLDEVEDVDVFHAATARADGAFVTAGGRVLGVTALGAGAAEARDRAYAAVERIDFDGRQVRGDIAARAVGIDRVAP